MTVALREGTSLAEFLAWEEGQELRYEFDGFRPLAMTSGTARHEIIGFRLRSLLFAALQGKPCQPWEPTAKIEVMGRIRYPDAFVSCTPAPLDETIIPDPVVVFEILSPGTSRTDRIEKLNEYQAAASIRRYVILEQDSAAAMVFWRLNGEWVARSLTGNERLAMPEIGIELSLSEVYEDPRLREKVVSGT